MTKCYDIERLIDMLTHFKHEAAKYVTLAAENEYDWRDDIPKDLTGAFDLLSEIMEKL